MTFEQYAESQGVQPNDPCPEIIDCAVEHYGTINPFGRGLDLWRWYDMANAYAAGVLITFAR